MVTCGGPDSLATGNRIHDGAAQHLFRRPARRDAPAKDLVVLASLACGGGFTSLAGGFGRASALAWDHGSSVSLNPSQ
jgi:hypothetical protein